MAKIQRTLYRGNANQILVHYPNLSISICRVLILYCRVQDVNFDELMVEVILEVHRTLNMLKKG